MNFIEYLIAAWFANLNNNDFSTPNYYDLTLMAKALILAETPIDRALLAKVEFIEENTNEELKIPVSVIDFMISRNFHKPFSQELSVYGKDLTITELHYHANRVLAQLIPIIVEISRKYSLEFQFKKGTSASSSDADLKLG